MAADSSHLRWSGRPHLSGISSHHREPLNAGWVLARLAPGTAQSPGDLDGLGASWEPALVPGTVAAAQRARGTLPELDQVENFDASDWWYRCHFAAEAPDNDEAAVLRFEGLATLAEIWLNGEPVAASSNMFRVVEVDVTRRLKGTNDLCIRFRSLDTDLMLRRSRPRWRTNAVEHQQLRWIRTTLLGRMPGWCPPVRPVGPWRPIWLERRRVLDWLEGDAMPAWEAGAARVTVDLVARTYRESPITAASLDVMEKTTALHVAADASGGHRITGNLHLPGAEAWWPHTHGPQPRYPAAIHLTTATGPVRIDLGMMVFRSITASLDDGGFGLSVNGVPIFCRGACWSTPDLVSLRPGSPDLERVLRLAQAANMNMLRVGGTMLYEDARFYELCDELGLLVWQDFMYASMDYPANDPGFLAEAAAEAAEIVAARRRFGCMAVYCGGSEVEQRAAMMGRPREEWSSALFEEVLPSACTAGAPATHYLRNSPSGGPLPFSVNTGIAHYYGVGAYLRPLEDARRAGVRFATECLGFSNVPEPATLESFLRTDQVPPHHPRWKARVPRENAAGWDFDDVRDYYLKLVYATDPVPLRYADVERYLALSRLATGEAMLRTFAEWRSSTYCRGGLVWFLQDLWPGAGCGVIDALGHPKAAWHYLRRAFAPTAVFLVDEGVNGVDVHVLNDTPTPLNGEVRLVLYRDGPTTVAEGHCTIRVPARGRTRLAADTILGGFFDVSGAYRFGPPGHDVVLAELREADQDTVRSTDLLFPHGLPGHVAASPGLRARVVQLTETEALLEVESERLAYGVQIDSRAWMALDNYFSIPPGGKVVVCVRGSAAVRPTTIGVQSLNGGGCHVRLAESPSVVTAG